MFSTHPHWDSRHSSSAIIIAPSIHHSKAKFSMYLINVKEGGDSEGNSDRLLHNAKSLSVDPKKAQSTGGERVQRFVYVLQGSIVIEVDEMLSENVEQTNGRKVLAEDCYIYISPMSKTKILSNGTEPAQLLVFDSLYDKVDASESVLTDCQAAEDVSSPRDHYGAVDDVPLTPSNGKTSLFCMHDA